MEKVFEPFDPLVAEKHLKLLLKTYKIKVKQWSAGANGRAWTSINLVKIPKPTNIEKFCVAMHELGHCIKGVNKTDKLYDSEYRAEQFAFEQAELFNWDYSEYKRRAKGYLTMCIAKGHCRKLNLDSIPQEIKDFCGVDFEAWKGKKVFVSNWTEELKISIQ